MAERWTALDLVEGFHLAHAVAALHEEGILAALDRPGPAEHLAERAGLDAAWLATLLDYTAARTELLEHTPDGYRATPHYDAHARGLLDQYIGAYGPNARQLRALLREPRHAAATVDRARHADAFAGFDRSPALGLMAEVIAQLGLGRLLDLGCGTGTLLMDLAGRDPDFTGWGVDANAAMCGRARRRLAEAGLAGRVTVLHGDCSHLESAPAAGIREQVETLSAASLLNEFFADGRAAAVGWLRRLRELFPGRALIVADYYGQVGRREPPWPRMHALHDVVQVISGQGVPPGDRAGWVEVYQEAGCLPVHLIEDGRGTFFVHILRL
ncbi:methyltransferase domain-containing protein [Kitasatospora sp. NPDC056181]|uniref:RiPP biosynthesis methyltransferase ApyS n=1 Tax=Kitasatospora sp. NPDC056181 TaxID=3345737 RepID=UPI0035D9AD69